MAWNIAVLQYFSYFSCFSYMLIVDQSIWNDWNFTVHHQLWM